MLREIPTYSAAEPEGITQAVADLDLALATQAAEEQFDVPVFSELIGVDDEVYRQIRGALRSGKRHLMFYGPPGTGKTSIAELLAGFLHDEYKLITGSADWSSQDIIGGYQPAAGGLRFRPGILLEHFDKPLIIDELNRCDIDKVIGPLFTVLSGQQTTLAYQLDPSALDSPRCVILPKPKPSIFVSDTDAQGQEDAQQFEFAPTENWRLFATINSIDKASLYQMSYALSRRFGWILVDVPTDKSSFVREYCSKEWKTSPPTTSSTCPVVGMWEAVNAVRRMGPAPFIDVLRFCRASEETFDLFAIPSDDQRRTYLDAFYCFVLPMLDGIQLNEADQVCTGVGGAIGIPATDDRWKTLGMRLADVAIKI